MTTDDLQIELKSIFEGFPEAVRTFQQQKKAGDGADYEPILLRIVKMKQLNALLAERLQKFRESNEGEKEKTDQLKLKSANLEYKKLHLIEDIETCKALATPQLAVLEHEMGVPLAASDNAKIDELPSLHERAIKEANLIKEAYRELEEEREANETEWEWEVVWAGTG